ncbi:hypothetical protein DICPUDRAFT_92720 [Dictyostelium purpureum]|uniref:RGS domain-containing protein n=1 Tax=Dictyostelium purpureum TaxID=5786 RepID=F0ZW98_DICPU|nr:uncharacterized protein DICPUDRAFT_92720 [Dictyostelium purpureum]EGC31769.1 hypothetical protein DICPUDRAFT_92720 [Dictyostelium purpureum]|eukprot:XP_003291692.1 hypothetical protein DICPUDRAFT_92720 [Dictyostelium purpureum]
MTKDNNIKLKQSNNSNNKIKKSNSGNIKKSSTSDKLNKVSNNSNIYNDDLLIEFYKDDIPFSKQTLNNLSLLLNNQTTRRIFIQFSEKEHSHNHVLFWQETKEFKEKFIEINQEQLSTQPETQNRDITMMNIDGKTSHSPAMPSVTPNQTATGDSDTQSNKNNNNNNGEPSTPRKNGASLNDEASSSSSTSPSTTSPQSTTPTNNNNNNKSPSQTRKIQSRKSQFLSGNRVSREATPDDTDDDSENEIAMMQKTNLKNCLYIFDKYLTPSSELEVNLDFKTFIEIKKKIDQNQITANIFEKSQKEIQEVIANDSYFRYKSSNTFRYLLTCAEQFEKDNSLIPSGDKPKLKSRKSKFFCM